MKLHSLRKIASLLLITVVGLSTLLPLHLRPANALVFSSATQVPTSTPVNLKPSATIDSHSNLWLAYESNQGKSNPQIFYKTFDGSTWTTETNITSTTSANTSPSVHALSNGTIFVAWPTNRTGYQEIFYKTLTGSVWSQNKQLTNDNLLPPNSMDDSPAVTQDLTGRIWVFWMKVTGSTSNIYYEFYTPGLGWGSETPLTADTDAIIPSSTVTIDGRVWVVFSVLLKSNYNLWYKTFDGSSWTPETRLTTYGLDDDASNIIQTRDGTIWIAWQREFNIATGVFGTDIYYENSTNMGSTWSAPTPITTSGQSSTGCIIKPCFNFNPSLVQTRNENLYFFWSSDMPSASSFNIWYQSTTVLTHDLAATNVGASPHKTYPGGLKSVGISPFVNINATFSNLGDFTETTTFTLTANSTIVGSGTITLSPAQTQVVFVNWNTSGVKAGCYLIQATIATVPGEVIIANNVHSGGYIHILPLGDLNQDGNVDVLDAAVVAFGYGSVVGSPGYNPYADINGDGKIDVLDAAVLAANYGIRTNNC